MNLRVNEREFNFEEITEIQIIMKIAKNFGATFMMSSIFLKLLSIVNNVYPTRAASQTIDNKRTIDLVIVL